MLDRQRGRSKGDGKAVTGEGRDMSETVADSIGRGVSLAMKMPAAGADHGLRLVP
jgi:hypothetical protein